MVNGMAIEGRSVRGLAACSDGSCTDAFVEYIKNIEIDELSRGDGFTMIKEY